MNKRNSATNWIGLALAAGALSVSIKDGVSKLNTQDETKFVHLEEEVEAPQLGVNFVRFFFDPVDDKPQKIEDLEASLKTLNTEVDYFQPEWIFNDFEFLGVDAFRQFVKGDLFWDLREPTNGEFNFRIRCRAGFSNW